ncbi:MAG: chorismate synthase [Lachnospiraceae bacterium]|nr:chorismate synthase [Lachnospiraceae bacterium]
MAGSTFGTNFTITTWGESHGKGLGVVVDGCPAGLPISEEIIQTYLNRRKPGGIKYSTPRKEADKVQILSGTMDGLTTGTPISMVVMNETQRSKDYSEIASYYRPGHADYTFDAKYGFRDYRGGGRSSGRETIGRVAGGAIAIEILKTLGIQVSAYTYSIGDIEINYNRCQKENILESPVYMPDPEASLKAAKYLDDQIRNQDSVGGIVECVVTGMPAGIGEPVFDKLDAQLGKAIMSIGAVKGFEIGSGFMASKMNGSANNDAFFMNEDHEIEKMSNNAGGVLGGISDGSKLILRAAFKPTPSIARTQETVNKDGENISINIKGRHDPIIVPRAVVVVEAMTATTILDLLIANMSSRMDYLKDFYMK